MTNYTINGLWEFTPWYLRWFLHAKELRRPIWNKSEEFGWVHIWEYKL